MRIRSYWLVNLKNMLKFRKLINYIFPVWDFAYILQLEEYNLSRYWHQVSQRLFKRNFEQRDTLKYTARMKLTLLKFFVICAALITVAILLNPLLAASTVAVLPLTTPYLIGLSSFAISIPVRSVANRKLARAAKHFAAAYPQTKVIAITGSFGKTTAKYMLQHVMQYNYRVAIIPDNLNTALGIAEYILSNQLPKNLDILIVEIGAYTIGDIAQSAKITPPDYALLTILGDQHLERFGSKEKLVIGKSEIFTTNPRTICYTPSESINPIADAGIHTKQIVAVTVPQGQKSTPYLVQKIAEDLGVSTDSMQASLDTFVPPERRNNILVRQGVSIIDNSYNISPMVAHTILKEASETAQAQSKKLVVMTGGIGEQGAKEKQANIELASLLNQYATRVLLNPTVFSKHMLSTLVIPIQEIKINTDVTDNAAQYLDGDTELLLWLTGHSDLAYI